MTLDQFFTLQNEDGQRLLVCLANEPLEGGALLPLIERLRKAYPAELVGVAVELARLRRQAAGKFSRAAELFFTREGLEMATAEPVARHTARRYAGLRKVLDLCCGLGGDALALAETAGQVIAVDRDPLTLEMARANARVLRIHDRLDFVNADVTEFVQTAPFLIGPVEAIFIDPSRRGDGHRVSRRPEDYSPPLSWCLELTRVAPRVGIKVSPALDYEAVPEAEVEIISLGGACKEAVLWLGSFRTCVRRATLLPGGDTLTEAGVSSDAICDIGAWLYEPDPAVIRAHLVQRLAGEFNLRRIDEEIAYLTGDEVHSPFLTGYRVQEVIPWSLKRVNAVLTSRGIGQVTIKKRGFPLTPEELRPKLKLAGSARATLICTRARGKAVVVVAE
ncbi:MAG: THUMP-like domain-containing protein [Armatimonadota bacterium]